MSTKRIGLFLEPLDVLFFRDGRPFEPASAAQSGLPMPQTLAGAIWTAILEQHDTDYDGLAKAVQNGKSFEESLEAVGQPPWLARVAVRGPWLAEAVDRNVRDVFIAAPAVLHQSKSTSEDHNGQSENLTRLFPLKADRLPGWQPPLPQMRPLWVRETKSTKSVSGFLGRDGLAAFLNGRVVTSSHLKKPTDLYDLDRRTGIVINPRSQSADEGLIYGARFLALNRNIGFYAEVVLPDEAADTVLGGGETIAFGGERRHVRVHRLPEPWGWPEADSKGDEQKPLVLLTTPGLFEQRWYPRLFAQQLVSASVPGDQPVSGWDLARGGPKPTRFAAQTGSVYFLNQPLDHWPAALSDDAFDRQQGWGCYLKGVWIDE